MTIAIFESFQPFDTSFAIGLQTVFGTPVTPDEYLLVRSVSPNIVNSELTSLGTSNYVGIIEEQRTKAGRYAQIQIVMDLVDTSEVLTALEWCYGTEAAGVATTTNIPKFATVGMRHTGGDGFQFQDCAVVQSVISFQQADIATLSIVAMVIADWQPTNAPIAGTPGVGTPLRIDDLGVTWNAIELPFNEMSILCTRPIMPTFANNAFPVSYQAPHGREVKCEMEIPSTDISYALMQDFRDDDSSDLVFTSTTGNFASTLTNARLIASGMPDFSIDSIDMIDAVFRATATDKDSPELSVTLA